MHRRTIALDDSLQCVLSEYLEMPGLCLSLSQAARFFSLDCSTCARLLDALVEARFLTLTSSGLYVRSDAPQELPTLSLHRIAQDRHGRARAARTTRRGPHGRR
jgi:hypothetical protein